MLCGAVLAWAKPTRQQIALIQRTLFVLGTAFLETFVKVAIKYSRTALRFFGEYVESGIAGFANIRIAHAKIRQIGNGRLCRRDRVNERYPRRRRFVLRVGGDK